MINSEFFDQYLKGKLSERERRALEEQASHDPLLQSEIKLQKGIYTALAEERKAMLKNRLNQVPISGDGLFSSVNIRWAAAISSMLLASLGTYYFANFNHNSEIAPSQTIDISNNIQQPAEVMQDQISVSVPKPATTQEIVADAKQSTTLTNATAPTEAIKTETDHQEKVVVTLPEVKHPDLSTTFADESNSINYDDFVAPDQLMSKNTHSVRPVADVEIKHDRKYNFHYRYEAGKLYLYGDFDEALYKVIALNREEDNRLFLEYEKHFYTIDNHATDITPLEMIIDSTLIKQLREINIK